MTTFAFTADASPARAAALGAARLVVDGHVVFLRTLDLRGAASLSAAQLHALAALLDATERARADRFVAAADRARFVFTRATLRQTLAPLLCRDPTEIAYDLGPFGKPSLAPRLLAGRTLHFNVSNTPTMALIAWSSAELGVDVEDLAPTRAVDELGIARVVFTPHEQAALANLPHGPDRRAAFYTLWVRKEAVLKALGTGFSRPAEQIDLGLEPAATWIDPTTQERLVLADLHLGAPYKAAVALRTRRSPEDRR